MKLSKSKVGHASSGKVEAVWLVASGDGNKLFSHRAWSINAVSNTGQKAALAHRSKHRPMYPGGRQLSRPDLAMFQRQGDRNEAKASQAPLCLS